MQQIIKEFYIEHKFNFEENFVLAWETSNPGAIHKMRTSMKRLRALFQLMQVLTDGGFKAKKQMKKGRGIFKFVGTIRELHVEEMLVYGYEEKLGLKFTGYSQYLFAKENREIGKFKKNLEVRKKDQKIFKDKDFYKALETINIEDVQIRAQGFINLKSNILVKLNKRGKTTESIHKNRTILKQVYYLYEILSKLSGWSLLLGMDKDGMREKEQQIGDWHDRVNSLRYLSFYYNAKTDRKTGEYRKLSQLIINERDNMKNDIIDHLYTGQASLWE